MTKSITVKKTTIGDGMPCICVPLTKKTLAALEAEAENAVAAAPDLVEWRADFFEGLRRPEEVKRALAALDAVLGDIPLIFTIRTQKEGGNAELSPEEYAQITECAAATKIPSLTDVEILQLGDVLLHRIIGKIHQSGGRAIGSSHDFEKTPTEREMEEILRREDAAGADILKLAVMPNSYRDLARLLSVTAQMRNSGCAKPVITMSMGERGSASRFLGEVFGSAVTFATAGEASAPGQLPIKEARELLCAVHLSLRNM